MSKLRIGSFCGFSMAELMMVMAIMMVVTAIGLPSLTRMQASYRISSDGRAITQALSLAKMRAGAIFTHERLNFDLSNNRYVMEKYDKSSGQFLSDGTSQSLSTGVSFGFGSITTPAGSQTSIQQSSTITFNSRGIPINNSGQPTADFAVYFSDTAGAYYAVTVSLGGRIQIWKHSGTAWVAQ